MKKQEKLQSAEINKAVSILKSGGVVIFPTDTVFGIGCIASDKKAVERIKQIKSSNQNFPILISSIEQAKTIGHFGQNAQKLAQTYWPGGLTIIIQNKKGSTVGVRMPDSNIVLSIIKDLKEPIIGTSANFHGDPAPTTYREINPKLAELVDLAIEGDCKNNKASTVIDTTVSPPKILRQGAVKIYEVIN